MNPGLCERESEVASAVRSRSWSAELGEHVSACVACSEARQVAESLLHYAVALHAEHEPVHVDRVWRQAQARKQQMILQRAQRPLIFMRRLSLGCALVFLAWLLRGFSDFDYRGWMRASGIVEVGTASAGAAIAVLCIAIGAWFLLYEGKRSDGVDVVFF